MKKIYNYAFKLVSIYILVLSIFSISSFEIDVEYYSSNISDINTDKALSSVVLIDDLTTDESISSTEDTSSIEISESIDTQEVEDTTDIVVEESEPEPVQEVVNIVDTSSYAVIQTETVNISHYGHDCYGCTTGYTYSGYYIGDGRIYYNDSTFGSLRVVAADSKYPIGTVIRLSYNNTTINAIVLDRGGSIGDQNRFQIDLLASSNSEAYNLGIINDAKLEVLRLGY